MAEATDPSDGDAETETDSAFASILRQVARAPGGSDVEPATELSAGSLVADRFEVVREIGRGGFGRVYEARDRVLSRDVAIKLLARTKRLGDRELELFYREARATARLNHPNIVTAYDRGEWQNAPFLVLELLEGTTLAGEIKQRRPTTQRAWQIARDITHAVAYAHSRGVVHLDLKSQNVFVLRDGTIKVLDFGLAGLDWDERERVQGGTPATMAPEQKRGEPTDARTDVYAIGVILHELLFGTLPVEGAAVPPGISRNAARVLRRTLAPEPRDRFPDAASLLAALEQRPRRVLWASAAIVALTALGAVAWLAMRETPELQIKWRHRQLTFRGDVTGAELSPTGDKIAFVTNKGRDLMVQSIDSDQPERWFAGSVLRRPRWFADGKRLVVTTKDGYHKVVAPAAEPIPLVTRKEHVVPMPDGTTIATLSGGRTRVNAASIAVMSFAGDREIHVLVPSTPTIFTDLDVDRDGRMLVAGGPDWQLWTTAAWQLPHRLISERADIVGARWHPEGVVYLRGWGRDSELQFRRDDGRSSTLLTGLDLGARISVARDGRRILYHRLFTSINLIRQSPDGTQTPITRGTAIADSPNVSPDGSRLAYVLDTDRKRALIVHGIVPGGTQVRVRCGDYCAAATWSPDGRRIAFGQMDLTGFHVVVVNADGSGERTYMQTHPSRDATDAIEWISDHELVYSTTGNGPLDLFDLATGIERPFLREPTTG